MLKVLKCVEDDAGGARGIVLALLDVDVHHDVIGVGCSDEGRDITETDILHPVDPIERSVEVAVGEETLICTTQPVIFLIKHGQHFN